MDDMQVVIEMIADTSKLSANIKKVIENIKDIAYKTEEFDAVVQNASGRDLKNITKGLKSELDAINNQISMIERNLINAQASGKQASVDSLTKQLKQANGSAKILEDNLNKVNSIRTSGAVNSLNALKSASDRVTESVKRTARRFAIGFMLGGFGTMRVAMREAINLSDTARNSFSAMSRIIGSAFIPIIDTMTKALMRALTWLAGFIKALTGFDMISKAMGVTQKKAKGVSSAVGKTTKAVKKLKGELAGFDEITNISAPDSDSGSGGGGLGGIGGADMDMMGSLAQMLEDMNNMNFDWVEKLRNGLMWIKDNWELVALGIMGITLVLGALKLASLLASVGLTGLAVPLVAIALAFTGVVAIVLGVIELFKKGGNESKAWKLILGGLVAIVGAVALAFGAIPAIIALVVGAVGAGVLWIVKHWEEVKTWLSNFISWGKNALSDFFEGFKAGFRAVKDVGILILTTIRDFFINSFLKSKENAINNLRAIGDFFRNIGTIFSTILSNIGSWFVDKFNTAKSNVSNALSFMGNKIVELKDKFFTQLGKIGTFFTNLYKTIKDKFKDIAQTVSNTFVNIIKSAINGVLKGAVKLINGFISSINFAIKLINKIPGVKITSLTPLNLPSFDVGTNRVPKDMVAQIHKGEAIIPEKFNDEKFFGGNDVDMSDTNSLLETIIEVLRNLNVGGDLNEDDIGKIAMDYINYQKRLRGVPVV